MLCTKEFYFEFRGVAGYRTMISLRETRSLQAYFGYVPGVVVCKSQAAGFIKKLKKNEKKGKIRKND